VTRAFLVATLVIAVVSFTWSRLVRDPECTDGPCAQDGPLLLGAGVWALLLLVYLVWMVVWAVRVHRRGR
jgi:hypothetical protein